MVLQRFAAGLGAIQALRKKIGRAIHTFRVPTSRIPDTGLVSIAEPCAERGAAYLRNSISFGLS